MKKHNGMRPHDVAVLLKIAAKGRQAWRMKDLAQELGISASEISESLHRSSLAGLLAGDKRDLRRLALLEFLRSGLRYVFPQQPGALVRGMPTAYSAPPLSQRIAGAEACVWPYAQGQARGQAVEPLHPRAPEAAAQDSAYYELLALADAIRLGKVRERSLAFEILQERIEHG